MRMMNNSLASMPIIEEREGEVDLKEEFEKKEKTYKKQIEDLQDTIDDLKNQEDTKRKQAEEIKNKVPEPQPLEVIMLEKDQEIKHIE